MHTFPSSSDILLKESYLAFAKEQLAPFVQNITQNQNDELRKKTLLKILAAYAQKGYLGITAAKEHGGQELPFLSLAFLSEVIGKFEPGFALTLASHFVLIELIQKYGNAEQKSRFLPILASGKNIGSYAFAEEHAGTDIKSITATLTKNKDGYILSGKKTWVVNGEIADLAIVLAHASENKDTENKLMLAIVELKNKPQIKISSDKKKMGLSSTFTNDVKFQELEISKENIIITSNGAYEQVLYAMDIAKVMVAAAALGIMDSAKNESVNHAQKHEQFGQNIGHFQGIQWKLADLEVALEGTRLQVYRAAWSKDEAPTQLRKYAAMCKLLASNAASLQSGSALSILASAGIAANNPIARFYTDAKVMEICEGTAEFQKLVLVDELEIEKP